MKKFSLLKKVCSVFVIISMLASVGMVAFAENPGAYVPDDNSVKITDIAYVASTTVTGLYNVTVKCEIGSDALDKNAIGVTMLTYAKKGEGLSADADRYTAYDDTMQIVGIDQKQREDGANTVEFKFAVTTNDNDGANAYAVQSGKAAVILVSGDGLTPAAGILTIRESKTAVSATVTYDGALNVYSYDTDATILAALKENLAAADATIADATDAELGTVALAADYIKSVAKKDDTTYTATAVIPADASVDSVAYNVTIPEGGLTVEFDFAVALNAWEADTVSYTFETEQSIAIGAVVSEADIKGRFVGKSIEVSAAGNDAAKATVTITEEMLVADAANPVDIAVDGVFNYTITVADTTEYTVTAADKEIDVKVTIVDNPTVPFDITAVELVGSVHTSYTGEEGASKEDIIEEVIFDLQNNTGLTATVKGAEGEVEAWNIDGTSWAHKGENGDKCIFAADIVAPEGALGVNKDSLKVEVEITITVVAPAALKGDVDGSTFITANDMAALKEIILDGKELSGVELYCADVDGSGFITANDMAALKDIILNQ